MDRELIGWLSVAAVFVVLSLRVPVAYALALAGFGGYWLLAGPEPALGIMAMVPFKQLAVYSFTVVPLFLLMGHLAYNAGFVTDIFGAARAWLRWSPGGVVQATVVGSAAFGAVCGSGVASAAVLGRVVVPELLKSGVERKFALGTVASVATLASMIPPSVSMVIYGMITEQSIGKLLVAGIIPGLFAAAVYMVMIYFRVKRSPSLAPSGEPVTWGERFATARGIWGVGLLAFLVMGGIYSGIFTPNEAAGVGAFGALSHAVLRRRLNWQSLRESLLETSRTTGMVFLIVCCAFIFGYLLAISQLPTHFSEFLVGLQVNRYVILVGVMLMYVVLGTFLDMIAAFFLTLPIIFPAMMNLGFDPIWFGVLMVMQVEIATITPPFAFNIFVLKGVVPNATSGEIIRGVVPYLFCDIFILAVYIAFPQLALFLPDRMMG